jgi:hypothetical protein
LFITLLRVCFVKTVSEGKESFNRTSFESFNKI